MRTDTKKVRQQARKLIGASGLDRLAEHDAALMHHASAIAQLIARQDDMLTKAASHAEQLDQAIQSKFNVAAAYIGAETRVLKRPFRGRLRWLLTGR